MLHLLHQSTFYRSDQFPIKLRSSVSQLTSPSPRLNHATTISKSHLSGRTCNIIDPALHPSETISSTTGLTLAYNPIFPGWQDWSNDSINVIGTTPAISSIVAMVTWLLVSSLMITSPSVEVCGFVNNFAEVWRYVIAFRKSPSDVFTRASMTYRKTTLCFRDYPIVDVDMFLFCNKRNSLFCIQRI